MSAPDLELLGGTPLTPVADRSTAAIETGVWKYLEPRYEDTLPPCSHACPAGNDISKTLALLATGDLTGAARLLRAGNPLSSTLGRVCPHPCEGECNREAFGGAIAIHALERFLGDVSCGAEYAPSPAPSTGCKVAIIGSGPAGIAAAYSLALRGHAVEVFDDKAKPGGYLRTGIPDYRLPKGILDQEIALVERVGVKFTQNVRIGRDLTFAELQSRFNAVVIAVGLHAARPLAVPGSDHPSVYDGVELLEQILMGERPRLPREMAVVGGGNTAIDVARSLRRLKVKPTIVYRRTEAEMPAIASEVEHARAEGVEFRFLAAPSAIIAKGGAVVGLECQQMRLGEPDSSGRRRPVPVPGEGFRLAVAGVVSAIGESAGMEFLPENLRKQITGVEGVFLAGDAATGEGTVTAAVGSGRRIAAKVDHFLHHGSVAENEPSLPGLWERRVNVLQLADARRLNTAYLAPEPRPKLPGKILRAPTSFAEIAKGLSVESAIDEARRCFACGTCNGCLNCYYWCPDVAIHGSSAGGLEIDSGHCKGCGICVEECPRGAMAMQEASR